MEEGSIVKQGGLVRNNRAAMRDHLVIDAIFGSKTHFPS